MKKAPRKSWHYHPELPLKDSSVFATPVNLRSIGRWFISNWLSMSEFVLLLVLATFLWAFCYPSVTHAHTFNVDWILHIFAVNFLLVASVAGSLHWYFYIHRGQQNYLKFDARELTRKSRVFLFSDQVKDNMFWSLTSGVAQLTFFQSITWWLIANNYIPTLSVATQPIGFLLGFVLLPIWSAFHFYWVHRFLHVPAMYKHIHSLHHKNINIGPWSGIAMHPLEHFLYFSSLCIHWLLSAHPLHVIFHVVWLGPGAAMSHTGYESLLMKDKRKLALGTFYHQLHHRYFECNYGNQEMPWDRWFGTFHDGSDEATQLTRQRKKKMYS